MSSFSSSAASLVQTLFPTFLNETLGRPVDGTLSLMKPENESAGGLQIHPSIVSRLIITIRIFLDRHLYITFRPYFGSLLLIAIHVIYRYTPEFGGLCSRRPARPALRRPVRAAAGTPGRREAPPSELRRTASTSDCTDGRRCRRWWTFKEPADGCTE